MAFLKRVLRGLAHTFIEVASLRLSRSDQLIWFSVSLVSFCFQKLRLMSYEDMRHDDEI